MLRCCEIRAQDHGLILFAQGSRWRIILRGYPGVWANLSTTKGMGQPWVPKGILEDTQGVPGAKRPETVHNYSLRPTSTMFETGVVSTIWSWFTQARTM
jgi:hypothetical protein